jgi:hypothetical protein
LKKDLSPVYDLIRADGSIVLNKNLCHAIGLYETVVYSELLSRYNYFNIREELDDEGYFYNTIDNFQLGTSLSAKQQKTALSNLEKLGLIKTKLKGVPAKRHFKIVDDMPVLFVLITKGKSAITELEQKQLDEREKQRKRREDYKQSKQNQLIGTNGESSLTELDNQDTPKELVNNTNLDNTNSNNTKNDGFGGIMEGTKPEGVSTLSKSSIPFYDYVGKLLKSYVDISKSLKQNIYESILYYCSRYEEEFGIEHIRYKTSTLKIVIKRLHDLYAVGIWDAQNEIMVGDGLTLEDFKTMTDKNFTVEFNGKGGKRMSYTLLSFLNDNVLVHRFYEELY